MSILGIATLAGCAPSGGGPSAVTPHPSPTGGSVLAALHGYLFALAGPDAQTQDVYKIQLHPFLVTRITHSQPRRGIDAIAANDRMIAATSADSGEDRVGRLYSDGTVRAFPGFMDPVAGVLKVFGDGRVGYSARTYPNGGGLPLTALRIYDPASQRTTTTVPDYAGRYGWTWAPDGLTMAYANTSEVRILRPDGEDSLLMKPVPRDPSVLWGPANTIAVVESSTKPWSITLLRPDGTKLAHLDGWYASSWSPDGSALIVLMGDATVAVWRPADGSQVVKIGAFPAGTDVESVVWTEADPLTAVATPPNG